jgi:hypothetical protein
MRIRWLNVLRDALAIVLASAVVRAIAIGVQASDGAVSALVFAVFAAGFCVAGCLSPIRRFAHLALVALAAWLILAANGALTGSAESPSTYVGFLVYPTLLGMLLGGAVSLAIVPRGAKPPSPPA